MRSPFHSLRILRSVSLFSLAVLLLLAGCGKLRDWYDAKAGLSGPHSVTISWAANNPPVAGYNVYREGQSGGPISPMRLTPQIVTGTQFTDTTVEAGRIYSYYVTSVDSKGLESRPSARISVTVPTTVSSQTK